MDGKQGALFQAKATTMNTDAPTTTTTTTTTNTEAPATAAIHGICTINLRASQGTEIMY